MRAPGALKGGTLSHFFTSIVAKRQKIERGTFGEKIFRSKVSQCRKKLKRVPFSLSRFCMLRGKRRKSFLVQFAGPTDSIWDNKMRHYNSRVSLHEAPTK